MSIFNLALWLISFVYALSFCRFKLKLFFSRHFALFYFLLFSLLPALRLLVGRSFGYTSLDILSSDDFVFFSIVYWLFYMLLITCYFMFIRYGFVINPKQKLSRFLHFLFPSLYNSASFKQSISIPLLTLLSFIITLLGLLTYGSRVLILSGSIQQDNSSLSFISGVLNLPCLIILLYLLEIRRYWLAILFTILLMPYYLLSGSKGFILLLLLNSIFYLLLRGRLILRLYHFPILFVISNLFITIGSLSRIYISTFSLDSSKSFALSDYSFNPLLLISSLNRYNTLEVFLIGFSKLKGLGPLVERYSDYLFQAPIPSAFWHNKPLNPCWDLQSLLFPDITTQCIAPGPLGGLYLLTGPFLFPVGLLLLSFFFASIFTLLSDPPKQCCENFRSSFTYVVSYQLTISFVSIVLEGTYYTVLAVCLSIILSLFVLRIFLFLSNLVRLLSVSLIVTRLSAYLVCEAMINSFSLSIM